jgi:hypothetical protein
VNRANELALRRERLLARSAALRLELVDRSSVLQRPLALADSARRGVHWLRTHPWWPLAGVALTLIARPRRALRWGVGVWSGWRSWRRVRAWIERLAT